MARHTRDGQVAGNETTPISCAVDLFTLPSAPGPAQQADPSSLLSPQKRRYVERRVKIQIGLECIGAAGQPGLAGSGEWKLERGTTCSNNWHRRRHRRGRSYGQFGRTGADSL